MIGMIIIGYRLIMRADDQDLNYVTSRTDIFMPTNPFAFFSLEGFIKAPITKSNWAIIKSPRRPSSTRDTQSIPPMATIKIKTITIAVLGTFEISR